MPTPTRSKKHPLNIAIRAACYSMLGALPLAQATTGGVVVGGSGTINQSGTNTTINQATQNLAINWQTFNVAANERVQFIQPNATSVALNRVIGNNGSVIAGRIDANGRVILVNPNGVFFSSTAVLNVGSIIASGLDIIPADFMKGQYIFNDIPGSNGTVINNGLINASLGGNVALLGKRVENKGTIVANLGSVTLAAGKQAVLTFEDGGLLGVRVSKEILQSELGVDPAVINSGTIGAQGGRVLLTASQSHDVFSKAVNTTGMEPATSVVVNADGTFTLGGGADVVNSGSIDTSSTGMNQNGGRIVVLGNNVVSSGTLKADAVNGNGGEIELHSSNMTLLIQNSVTSTRAESDGRGGTVKVLGDKVGLFDQSVVDVSGANGGGQALIGGDFQGKNAAIHNATTTLVDRDTKIIADALKNGDGGKVILWADGTTRFLGSIFTRGGALSGNGGFVETSGKNYLQFDGVADRSAANGLSGLLLLDPDTIYIATSTVTGTTPVTTIPLDTSTADTTDRAILFTSNAGNDITITPTTLQNALTTGSVLLQATNDIHVNSSVTTASTTSNLTLEARDDININAPITMGGGDLTLRANTGGGNGHVFLNRGITTNGGDLFVYGDDFDGTSYDQSGTIINVSIDTGVNGNATILMTGDARLGGMVVGGNLAVTAGLGADTGITQGQVNLTNDVLSVTGTSTFTSSRANNDITLSNNNDLRGAISLTTNGGYQADASLTNTSATTTLANASVAGNLTVDAAQNLTVTGTVEGRGTDGVAAVQTTALNLNFGRGGSDSTFTATGATIRERVGAAQGNDRVNINITGGNGNNTFNINNATIATINGALNTNRGITIGGGTGNDIFNIATNINGLISGGDGNDRFNINASGIAIYSVEGNAGTNTLASGVATANSWLLNNADSGTLTNGGSAVDFTGIANLDGGTGQDNFIINNANGTLSGLLDGGGGPADTLTLTAGVDVQLHSPAGVLANQGGRLNVTGIETITDNSIAPNIVYADNTANSWTIDATGTTVAPSIGFNAENTVRLENFTQLNGGTGIDTFAISATYGGTINGGNGNDFFNINIGATVSGTLNGDAGNDSFNILANAPGTLNGGADNDTFTLGASGVAGIIDGGTQTAPGGDTLIARQGVANTWNFTSTNSGSLAQVGTPSTTYVSSFSDVENFSGGGTGAEWANFSSLGAVSINAGSFVGFAGVIGGAGSTLNGTSGNDQFTVQIVTDAIPPSGNNDGTNDGRVVFSGNTLRFIDFATLNGVDGIDTFTIDATGSVSGAINGGLGSSTLVGRNTATTWTLTGPNTGTVGITSGALYVANFSNIQNLTGGTDADSFVFNNGSSLTGTLNGGAGIDNVNMAALATVNVTLGATGFSNIEAFVGNNTASTLTGDNTLNTWALTGQNDGTVNGITFTDFNNLVGGNTTDTFTFGVGSSLTGLLNGGLGTDSVNMAALATVNVILGATGFSNIEQITGNNTNSTLTGDNTLNTWTLTGQNDGTVNGLVFTDFNNLTGGTGNDTFIYNIGGSLTGLLNGGLGTDSVNLAALTTVNVILGATGFSNIEQITGNNTASTLNGDTANTWFINGQNDGTVNSITFVDFNNLVGGSGNDTFNINGGQLTGLITGGTGINTLNINSTTGTTVRLLDAAPAAQTNNPAGTFTVFQVGTLNGDSNYNHTLVLDVSNPLTTSAWNINAENSGTVNFGPIATFYGFRNLTGSALNDTFTLASSSQQELVTGLINGGGQAVGGEDVLILTGMTGGAAGVTVRLGNTTTPGQLNVNGIERIEGNNSSAAGNTATLIADNGTNNWTITGTNDGTVTLNVGTASQYDVTFNNFNALRGGDGNDNFQILTNVLTASIAGGGHVVNTQGDTIDYSAQTTVVVNFGTGAFNGITEIESVVGNGTNSTFNGPTSGSPDWEVTGINTGSVTDDAGFRLGFVGFNYLVAGNGNDTFAIAGGSLLNVVSGVPGLIQGGGGTNTLAVALTGSETGQVNYVGSTGTDNLIITGTAGTYNGAYTPGATLTNYDQLAYTSGTNTTFTLNYRDVDTVQTNRTLATLTVNGSASPETIELGTGTFAVGTRTPVSYQSVSNLTVDGLAGSDTINLNNLNIAGTLTLTSEFVTSTPGTTLTADTLNLSSVGQFGATGSLIDTDIVTLQMANTGPVYINETDNLNINTTGSVTNSGIFRIVGGTTTINAGGGSLTLDNAENDFDRVDSSNAASITLRDRNSIARGNMTADSITLTTATGIGGATVDGASNDEFVTNTADLTVNNASGGVYITNNGSATVAITNSGDIGFTNNGNLIVDKLYTGGVGFLDRSLYRNVRLNVNGGSVQGIQGIAGRSIYDTPDITAFDLRAIVQGGGGFGNVVRPISISVSDTFTYLGGRGYVHYFGARPPHIFGADDLVIFSALDALSSLQLLEVESLDEFDPAIFTEVRNYYYEDVAIMMPADQRLDAVDEDEKEKDEGKEGKL